MGGNCQQWQRGRQSRDAQRRQRRRHTRNATTHKEPTRPGVGSNKDLLPPQHGGARALVAGDCAAPRRP
eukprot:11171998-Lingulodinium_polyedra.AAC.1